MTVPGSALDLCRDDYAVAVVTVDSWEVVRPSPLAFRRSKDMLPLPLPVVAAGDALAELRTVLKFESEEHNTFWTLYVGFMFATLRPVPPYFILAVAGEQGAGRKHHGQSDAVAGPSAPNGHPAQAPE